MSLSARRAWIEISQVRPIMVTSRSLSARRAWIEIKISKLVFALKDVALRKESVDRNIRREMSLIRPYASLSARRAWIEMRKK